MNMPTLPEYLLDPCGTFSLPYWKAKAIAVPPHMKIVHQRAFRPDRYLEYRDTPYFRLFHDLKHIQPRTAPEIELVPGADPAATGAFVQLICASYTDLSVSAAQIDSYRRTPVYDPDLWVLLRDRETGIIVAGGIADLDQTIGELILEWIQVLPPYRRRGYGQITVNHLLTKAQPIARFATVSGKCNAPTCPEALYRKCGFTGQDIWHILTRQ